MFLSSRAGPLVVAIIVSVCVLPAGAAPTLDLTTIGSSGTVNGAYFEQIDPEGSTGTGVISSFVRMQATPFEQGYNSGYRDVEFDEKTDSNFNRNLLLSEVPIVLKNGILYREFLLDIHEAGGTKGLLSLDTIEIYLSSTADNTGYPSLGTKIFDLDSGGDAWILLDGNLTSGSGSGDMYAFIPNTLFTGFTDTDYVYMYSKFGTSENNPLYESDGTFEEWAVRVGVAPPPPPPIPVPGALLLALLGSGVTISLHRRKTL